MQAWQATVQNEVGNIVPNPIITVYLDNGVTLASIFNENETPKANPFTGTLEGFAQFWANPGDYKIVGAAVGGDETAEWSVRIDTDYALILEAVSDAETAAGAAARSATAANNAADRAEGTGTPQFANIAALRSETFVGDHSAVLVAGKIYVRDDVDGEIASADGQRWNRMAFHGRFDKMVADAMDGETVIITAFGDSTTDGNGSTGWTKNPVDGSNNAIGTAPHTPPNAWTQMCQNALRSMFANTNISVFNAGYSGAQLQTGWAYNNYNKAVLGPYPDPDAVIVSFGINDVRQPYFNTTTFETRLIELCHRIARLGAFPIFQLPDEPISERHNGWLLGKVRGVYRSVAEQLGVKVIDWGTAMNELSQCSDSTTWRWGLDQPDDTHGNDALHSVKGGYIAACIYPHTVWVTQPITDLAPWSKYCKPIDGYVVFQGTFNKFGGAMVVVGGSYTVDQSLLDVWVWSVGAARNMYWSAVDGNGYYSPRTIANAPLIGMYDYVSKVTQTLVAPASGFAQGIDGSRDAEAPGRVFRVPQGLSRWAFRAPRDNNANDVYVGYFSIREVDATYSSAVPLFAAPSSARILDRDPGGDMSQVFAIQHGRVTNLALTLDLQPGMGVSLWSARVYGGSTTRESNRKRGLFLFRHATDNRLFLYSAVFDSTGAVLTQSTLGVSTALSWSGARKMRIAGGVSSGGQYINVYDGWDTNSHIISFSNPFADVSFPWGGTPGAIWQFSGATGVAGLTIYGDV